VLAFRIRLAQHIITVYDVILDSLLLVDETFFPLREIAFLLSVLLDLHLERGANIPLPLCLREQPLDVGAGRHSVVARDDVSSS
jgi:hypothetical protein